MCSICTNEETFSYHSDLIKHLIDIHNIHVSESNLNFRNFEEFTQWRAMENREVDYVCQRKYKLTNGEENMVYNCNRSDVYGNAFVNC